jgi:hypothetical protein
MGKAYKMVQHLSVRVPWHDSGWNGCICQHPERNQACRVLKNIAEKKDDFEEQRCSGCNVVSGGEYVPPCVTESGLFMSDHEVQDTRSHPYVYDKHYEHILDTDVIFEPYSFVGRPYKWTLKDNDSGSPNCHFFTQYDPTIEIDVGSGYWVSNGKNQERIFDYFYQNVKPDESLVVAYAKAVPFIENSDRIVIGIGYISSLGSLCEYNYSKPPHDDMITAFLWERQIGHTIRTDRDNGFLFPFAEIQSYLKEHPLQKPEDLVVIAPEEHRKEFSYATEHLSHDALIQTLNAIVQVLRKYKEIRLDCGKGADWDDCIAWCETCLHEVWTDRRAYPGLGAVLSALGVPYGFDVANVLKTKYNDNELWNNITGGLKNISKLLSVKQKSKALRLSKTVCEDIEAEIEYRGEYLELLSRITLTLEQAQLLLDDQLRAKLKYADPLTDIHKIDYADEIVKNPYLLYEKTYMLEPQYQFGIGQIDIAMFPPDYVSERFPEVDGDIRVCEPDDKRRLRAIIVSVLEREAANGSSLMLINDVVTAVSKFRSDVPDIETNIRLKTIKRLKEYCRDVFSQIKVAIVGEDNVESNDIALQLIRLSKVDGAIRKFVDGRINKSNNTKDDWNALLDRILSKEKQSDDERERAARTEKVLAIEKMVQSQISVLTGGAGTGKTTTLVALCMNEVIQRGRILILAPTGKARVVLSSKLSEHGIEHSAKTLFQYLKNSQHCDFRTWSYYLSGKSDFGVAETVIIDECSMLTEEM